MANTLYQRTQRPRPSQEAPDTLFNRMYRDNPEFRKFADSVRNKTPEEAFRQYGLDFDRFRHMKW